MKPVLVVPCVALSALLLASCGSRVEGSTAVKESPTVAVQPIARSDVAQTLRVAAAFKPYEEIEVHAKVAGYVKSIAVDVGDRVRAGQLLAELEVPELEDDMLQNDAEVKRAEEEVNRSKADLDRAHSAYEVAHLGASRLMGVSKARPTLIAQQDVDEANGRDKVAEAQVATAQAALAAAGEQLDAAKAARQKTATLAAYARITAPFAGVITHRYADPGAMIQAGTSSQTQAMPIVTLSDNARLRLVIPVPESGVADVRIGSPVQVRVDALNRTIEGTVARFADRLDSDTRTMRVEVDVPNADLSVVPGMYAEASLVLEARKNVVVAPIQAIDRDGDTAHALVVNAKHQIEPRNLKVGLSNGDAIEVTSGLAPGDLIVVGPRAQLSPGASVTPKVVPSEPAAAGQQ